MKKIVNIAINQDEVREALHLVNNLKYYGIVSPFFPKKGFICRERYDSGKYNTICSNVLTNHNGWTEYENASLAELINDLRRGGFPVYEFDTPQELFAWLAERIDIG